LKGTFDAFNFAAPLCAADVQSGLRQFPNLQMATFVDGRRRAASPSADIFSTRRRGNSKRQRTPDIGGVQR
jgi:hypothetical protein